jgi:opacity protein-like surface antigen
LKENEKMKATLITATSALLALSVAGAASAQTASVDPQWYVRVDGGATFQDEVNATPKVKGKTGWTADIAAGRALNANVRAEGELLYSQDDQKNAGSGRIKVLAGLANGYYDFDTGTPLRPFIGAGVGIGQVKLADGPVRGDDTGLAYQLMTGVAYPINDKLSAQVGYRYLGVNDVKIGSATQAVRGDYHDQAITAGLTYRF